MAPLAISLKVPWSELHGVIHFVMGKCNSDHGTKGKYMVRWRKNCFLFISTNVLKKRHMVLYLELGSVGETERCVPSVKAFG